MIDPVTGALIGAGLNVAGSLIGEWWASADEEQRAELEKQAAALYGDISAPTLEKVLAEQMGPSAMEDVQVDAGARQARRDALSRLMEEGLSGGDSAESRLALEESRRATAQQERAQRGALMQNARARGVAGSGLEMAAQLQSQQGGADRNAMAGMQAAADARRRALASLAQGGDMAAGLEADDFGQKSAKAQAADRIAQFNAANRQQANLYNAGLAQQDFQNRMSVADAKAEALYRQSDSAGRRADRKRRVAGGAGQGLGYAATAYGQGSKQQKGEG